MAAFSVASVGVFLFEVATDSSRSAPLLDLAVYSAVFIAGLVGIIALIGLLVGKEIDDDEAIDNPSWLLRAKVVFAMLFGIVVMVGILYAYRFWLTG
ncbi:MAG: hypothetical protein CMI63_08310 [Parvularcula sp.]|nr:hypothetical protein [Parvularcula sp.]